MFVQQMASSMEKINKGLQSFPGAVPVEVKEGLEELRELIVGQGIIPNMEPDYNQNDRPERNQNDRSERNQDHGERNQDRPEQNQDRPEQNQDRGERSSDRSDRSDRGERSSDRGNNRNVGRERDSLEHTNVDGTPDERFAENRPGPTGQGEVKDPQSDRRLKQNR